MCEIHWIIKLGKPCICDFYTARISGKIVLFHIKQAELGSNILGQRNKRAKAK